MIFVALFYLIFFNLFVHFSLVSQPKNSTADITDQKGNQSLKVVIFVLIFKSFIALEIIKDFETQALRHFHDMCRYVNRINSKKLMISQHMIF